VYECGEGLEEDEIAQMNKQLQKTLKDVRIAHDSIIVVDDNSQNFELKVSIVHEDKFPEEEQFFEVVGTSPVAAEKTTEPLGVKPVAPAPAPEANNNNTIIRATEDEEDIMIVEAPPAPKKRKLEDSGKEENDGAIEQPKKTKTTATANTVVELD
jgi:hypothetical protein